MTPEQVKLVQESFSKVAPIADKAADLFYDRLFAIAPEVRRLFPDDLSQQKKKLMQMLATAVTNLHQVEKILPAVQDLGRRHVAYGVTPSHYEPVGAALLWTLEQGLGPDFTPAVKEAWTTTYTTVAKVMTDAATQVPTQTQVPAGVAVHASATPSAPARKGLMARLFG
ncbi:MAG TPA: globin family protein [Xanthobacteraceae bacterium]|nr:globin family protein [Xanthobacteraceae bacterium]